MSSSTSQYFSFIIIFLLIFVSTFSSHLCSASTDKELKDDTGAVVLRMEEITKALSDAGYNAMSLTLQMTLPTLLSSHQHLDFTNATTTAFTIFCPPDEAFFSLMYPHPPLTLLQYHVSPTKLEKATLMESTSSGSKIDTLLPRHPLVVTTLPDYSREASINGVEIKRWDVYNDGVVSVHGIGNFFDPAYQTILYTWFDGAYSTNDATDDASMGADITNIDRLFKYVLLGIVVVGVWLILYGFVGRLICYSLLHACGYGYLLRQMGGVYALLGSSSSDDDDYDSLV